MGKTDSDEPIDEDRHGNPIVNANGEPIEGATKQLSDLTVSITRNYQTISMPVTEEYLHSVNSDQFLGFPAGRARIREFSAKEKFAAEIGGYYEVHAGIQFRRPYNTTNARAWWFRTLHEGYKIRLSASGGTLSEPIRATVPSTGQDEASPVRLNEDGTRNTSGDAHWLEFEIYKPLPYNALGLL